MKKLVIIGGGPGGYETAIEAAKKGLDVTIVEKNNYGGVCLHEGCIPTKTLLHVVNSYAKMKKMESMGLNVVSTINLIELQKYKHKTIDSLKNGIIFNLAKNNVKMINGTAILVDNHYISVDNILYPFDYLIIATGSVPKLLNIPIEIKTPLDDSSTLLNLTTIPNDLTIIGGGVIALEFASLYNALGTNVRIIEFFDEILPNFDKETAKRLRLHLKKSGVEFILNAKVNKISETTNYQITFEQQNIEYVINASKVMMATGRIPNLSALNFSALNIELDKAIKVNEYCQTNIANIYAIGDCNGKMLLAHSAVNDGKLALSHILNEPYPLNNLIPSVVYGVLELASVGLTEEQCIAKKIIYACHKSLYYRNGRATCTGASEGFIKILTNEQHQVIGASILGESADILIHELMAIIYYKGTIEDINNMIHAHPTLSEIISETIREYKTERRG